MDEKSVARFWAKVDKRGPDECWLWTASKVTSGYGYFKAGKRAIGAHRAAWTIASGTAPEAGLCVCHRCDVRECCNPAHLFLGTNDDNVADKVSKGRQARTIGESHPMVKLTEALVLSIRAERADTGISYNKLGAKHGISKRQAMRIVAGKSWAHLT